MNNNILYSPSMYWSFEMTLKEAHSIYPWVLNLLLKENASNIKVFSYK